MRTLVCPDSEADQPLFSPHKRLQDLLGSMGQRGSVVVVVTVEVMAAAVTAEVHPELAVMVRVGVLQGMVAMVAVTVTEGA